MFFLPKWSLKLFNFYIRIGLKKVAYFLIIRIRLKLLNFFPKSAQKVAYIFRIKKMLNIFPKKMARKGCLAVA